MRRSNKTDAKCFICRKKIKDREEYTSINKGVYSEEGDNDWIALIFHHYFVKNLSGAFFLKAIRFNFKIAIGKFFVL